MNPVADTLQILCMESCRVALVLLFFLVAVSSTIHPIM